MAMTTIREATKGDIPELVELFQQLTGNENLSEDYDKTLEKISKRQDHHLLLAKKDGKIVGSLFIVVVPNMTHKARSWAIIENVIVDGKYRSKGVGKVLMKAAEDIARKHNCYKITICSSEFRKEAHKFYGRLGYIEDIVGFRKHFD